MKFTEYNSINNFAQLIISGTRCLVKQPRALQEFHQRSLQRQRLRRFPPKQRRLLAGNQSPRGHRSGTAGSQPVTSQPDNPRLLRRRTPRTRQGEAIPPLEGQGRRDPGPRLPPPKRELLRSDVEIQILPVPERVRGGEPEDNRVDARRMCAGGRLRWVRFAVRRCA